MLNDLSNIFTGRGLLSYIVRYINSSHVKVVLKGSHLSVMKGCRMILR